MKIDVHKFAGVIDPKVILADEALSVAVQGLSLLRNRVLVLTYVEPSVTSGGIHLTDRRMEENRFQGKCGLVLKNGPHAYDFPEDDEDHVVGPAPKIGEWVMFRNSDTWEIALAGSSCRVIYDEHVVAIVEDPKTIY